MATGITYNTSTGKMNPYNTVTGKKNVVSTPAPVSSGGGNTNQYSTVTGDLLAPGSSYVNAAGQTINQGSAIGSSLTPTIVNTPKTQISSANLQVGSTGQSVKDLQTQLGITADGIFGTQTQAAVKAYQSANGLVSDGIVGNNTAGKMNGTPTPPSNILSTDTLGNTPKVTIPDTPLATDYTGLLNGLNGTNVNDTANAGINVNTQNNADILTQFQDLIGTPPSTADAYQKAQQQTGILKAQQERNDLSANLNQIVAQGQAASLQLESNAGGKGVTSTFLSRQQQEISRNVAIQALPVSAQLQAAQGNLETATQNLNTLFKIYSDDATNAYNYRVTIATAFKDVATSAENKKLDIFLKQIENQQTQIQADIKLKRDLTATAMQNQAPASVLSAIANSKTYDEALQAAGKYGGDYLKTELLKQQIETEKAQRANIYANTAKTKAETGAGKPPTASQSTAAGFASRVVQAKDLIDANTPELTKLGLANFFTQKKLPNALQSPLVQKELQAERNFVNAVLRRESGAAISPTEFDSAAQQYFPQPGDSQAVLDQKKANRDLTSQNLINESGSAYTATTIPISNPFSTALGQSNQTIQGTSIIDSISNGIINFNLPK